MNDRRVSLLILAAFLLLMLVVLAGVLAAPDPELGDDAVIQPFLAAV